MEEISRIKEILEITAKERKFITIDRLFNQLKISDNSLNKKKVKLILSLINDEFYQERGIIISSLILDDKKYFPIDLFIDYAVSQKLIKKSYSSKRKDMFWKLEAEKCFAYYDKVWYN
jgi:hypothetical protein